MYCPGETLADVLRLFGDIDWGAWGIVIKNDENLKQSPVVVWRYREKDERRDQLIVDAVKKFNGEVQWKISFRDREKLTGRNWSIMPEKLERFIEENEFEIGVSPQAVFASQNPEIGLLANKELPQLAEHIKKTVQQALNSAIA
jgi:hypothetical protein